VLSPLGLTLPHNRVNCGLLAGLLPILHLYCISSFHLFIALPSLSPAELAASLTEYWSPRAVAEIEDSY